MPQLAYVASNGYVDELAEMRIGFEDSTHPDGIRQRAVPLVEGKAILAVGPKIDTLR